MPLIKKYLRVIVNIYYNMQSDTQMTLDNLVVTASSSGKVETKLINYDNFEMIKELDLGGVKARLFKGEDGKQLVDIRQYFKERPTKKGVRIPLELYNVIKDKF
jgi:hypothetical protein